MGFIPLLIVILCYLIKHFEIKSFKLYYEAEESRFLLSVSVRSKAFTGALCVKTSFLIGASKKKSASLVSFSSEGNKNW